MPAAALGTFGPFHPSVRGVDWSCGDAVVTTFEGSILMSDVEELVHVLSDEACWALLKDRSLGRIATSAAKEIDIFPVNYYSDGSTILLRTAPGTKLVEMTIKSEVAFEIDEFSDTEAWSVVVKGTAHLLETHADIDEAEASPLTSWIPTLKYAYVRITPTSVSGRHFVRGPEPERF